MKSHTKSLSIQNPWERVALRVVCVALAALVCTYLYLIIFSITNVMTMKEAQVQSQRIENSISMLDTQYFNLTKSITPEDGIALGLGSVEVPQYITRPGVMTMDATADHSTSL
ncbi:MAG: hypothetical protein JWO50_31 [Candidatus Kaiserbacteria bacterium]|nr:hypothetical protein [Candidatus Kaiserbacteria bacterium]